MNESNLVGTTSCAPRSAADIAENVLGEIAWASPTMGYCECPGKKQHSSKDGAKDCAVYLDRVPTVSCFHGSCKAAVDAANKRLRAAILNPNGDADYVPRPLTKDDREKISAREKAARLQLRARKALPCILKQYRWTYDAMLKDSPVDVSKHEDDHWKLLLGKFKPDDVIWIGDKCDSGHTQNKENFRPASEWLNIGAAPGMFTCPASFKNTTYSRSNENILERRFLVVESDLLTRDEVGAVFRYLESCGLRPVAVVDTGGKSLHGWFEYPDDKELLEGLRLILPALKCDPRMLTASQPARLPGAMRADKGKRQKLIYLAREELKETV